MRARGNIAGWVSISLLPLAAAGCRLDPPNADDFLGTDGTTDDAGPPPMTSGTTENLDGDSTAATLGDGSGDGTGEGSSSGDTDLPDPVCGNGIVETGELCDDGRESSDCDLDCTPRECGDETVNAAAGEECDEGEATAHCDDDCTLVVCGDSLHNAPAGEQCDDGEETETCDADCTLVVCGDLQVNTAVGEQCDEGGETATCDANCTLVSCGDHDVNGTAGEQCDEGGETATCDANCTLVSCGDGDLNGVVGEECDEGGETDVCDVDCTFSWCGDGTPNTTAGELCDEAGRTAACDADCTLIECGDGLHNAIAGEQCDDGGESATCNANCTIAACGDGIPNVTAGEQCDHMGDSLTCDADCTPVECGDSHVNAAAGEQCDGTDLAGATCLGQGFDGGTLACDISCTLDTSGCFECGDGSADAGEQCDGGDLGGQTCTSLGFDGGALGCSPTCGFVTAGCYSCGDGTSNPGEQCDGADLDGASCASLGFTGGVLGCGFGCTYDTTGCYGCSDGIQNGDETDVDCGSSCGPTCEPGDDCLVGTDCASYGCIAATGQCDDYLSVEAAPSCSNYAGVPVPLSATATGGTGTYDYAWTPNDGSLSAPDQPLTNASPSGIQSYMVTVDDGHALAQDSVVVVNAEPLNLETNCTLYAPGIGGGASISYDSSGTRACELVNNGLGLHLCEDVVFENVRLQGTLQVTAGGDDDMIGLVWGAQDSSHFYSLTWKAGPQSFFGCPVPAGIVVKRVEAPTLGDMTGADLYCPNDTPQSTLLLGPAATTTQPWVAGQSYTATIDFTAGGSTVTIVRDGDGVEITSFGVVDTTFTSGFFGSTTLSQANACVGPLSAECL